MPNWNWTVSGFEALTGGMLGREEDRGREGRGKESRERRGRRKESKGEERGSDKDRGTEDSFAVGMATGEVDGLWEGKHQRWRRGSSGSLPA